MEDHDVHHSAETTCRQDSTHTASRNTVSTFGISYFSSRYVSDLPKKVNNDTMMMKKNHSLLTNSNRSQSSSSVPPSVVASSSSSVLPYTFYWSRPIGASDSSIRLTIIAHDNDDVVDESSVVVVMGTTTTSSSSSVTTTTTQRQKSPPPTKPSVLVPPPPPPRRINHRNVNIVGCCWAIPITHLSLLLLEIQKTLSQPSTILIKTLEVCFHCNNNITTSNTTTTGSKSRSNESRCCNDVTIWNAIAHELVRHSGSYIQEISFLYYYRNTTNSSSTSSTSSS